MMKCRICGLNSNIFSKAVILNQYEITYYYCSVCGFLQTEEPFWLKEAYVEAINISDAGILQRNIYSAKISSILIYYFFDKNAKYCDYAGGYGLYTRLMRDVGFDFYWHDPYTKNLFARDFEYDGMTSDIELVTSFESFEHFSEPITEIEKMLDISNNILFTTEILPNIIPYPHEWWYYGLDHGQHISFYSLTSLHKIADKYKLNLYTNGINVHLLTCKKLNQLYFKLLLKSYKLGMSEFVKMKLKSKTADDMKQLIARNK